MDILFAGDRLKENQGVERLFFAPPKLLLFFCFRCIDFLLIFFNQHNKFFYQSLRVGVVNNPAFTTMTHIYNMPYLVGHSASALKHANGLIILKSNGKFIQSTDAAANGYHGISRTRKKKVAPRIIKTRVDYHLLILCG